MFHDSEMVRELLLRCKSPNVTVERAGDAEHFVIATPVRRIDISLVVFHSDPLNLAGFKVQQRRAPEPAFLVKRYYERTLAVGVDGASANHLRRQATDFDFVGFTVV